MNKGTFGIFKTIGRFRRAGGPMCTPAGGHSAGKAAWWDLTLGGEPTALGSGPEEPGTYYTDREHLQ